MRVINRMKDGKTIFTVLSLRRMRLAEIIIPKTVLI